jgi:hypothetical protein
MISPPPVTNWYQENLNSRQHLPFKNVGKVSYCRDYATDDGDNGENDEGPFSLQGISFPSMSGGAEEENGVSGYRKWRTSWEINEWDAEYKIRFDMLSIEILRAQYNGLTKSFLEGQMEKENLSEQVRHLKRCKSSSIEV